MYQNHFFITDSVSNNAFSFDKRVKPKLYVPDLIEGNLENVGMGDEIVFEDTDENGDLKSCKGLRHFVRIPHPETKKPIVVVDNHNHVFYFWYEALQKGLISESATLVHIDQHKDTRKPDELLNSRDLETVFKYTNSILNVGNYIPPAMEDGLIGELISVTSESDLQIEVSAQESSIILNIDLDFWAPEMNYI
ncbi:UPF0489 family protein, partial [Candidatus Pacearchaeota archaeon]|nr:UPF0489 family protein [Candidatus Pacearchaeota archaeon]